MVSGKRSPFPSTRSMTKWPGRAVAAICGASSTSLLVRPGISFSLCRIFVGIKPPCILVRIGNRARENADGSCRAETLPRKKAALKLYGNLREREKLQSLCLIHRNKKAARQCRLPQRPFSQGFAAKNRGGKQAAGKAARRMTGTADGACRPCAGNSEALSVSLPISLPHHTTRGYGAAGLFTKPERSGTGASAAQACFPAGTAPCPACRWGLPTRG